ncbi:armadillo repeat-containing protein 8 [Ananas comosus]|uniref:Armadillo repeat-containing protein 8 n=1 Tax=Ananas comosus TaxID=4615 RepID=A0A6P5G859_ANACO|nr:armadillo repeat-containing protein 8 [Ananas comosus]
MPTSSAAIISRPEELTERLSSGGGTPTGGGGDGGGEEEEAALVRAIREVKNQIIGNKTKKLLYLELGAVPKIAAALVSPAASAALLVQAAAAVGSFACGVEDGRLLSHPEEKVVDAAARSLKMIFQSTVAPKYDVLQEKNMNFLLSLLNSENENVTELAATIITHSCQRNAEQMALADAGVLQRLTSLLGGFLNQRDACLQSITAIVKNNSKVASKFVIMANGKAFNSLVELMKDRNPRTRLLACVCLIAIGNSYPYFFRDIQTKTKMILILLELLEEHGRVGDEAPSVLTNLIADNEELHKQAVSNNAVEKLCNFLGKSPIEARRLEGVLLALAELCSKLENSRSLLMSLQVSHLIVDALKHDNADVRVAACTCIKNIFRSLKNLSAGNFSSDSIVVTLIQLLHDRCTSVQFAALGAICNVSVNFTTRKSSFFQYGGVSQLIQLSKSMDSILRLKSVSALRNLMFLLDRKDKDNILIELSVPMLMSLICDDEHLIQEQALTLVGNFVDGCGDSIKHLFAEDNEILNVISRQLCNSCAPGVCIQGMFALSNIAAVNESLKAAVMNCVIPPETDNSTPLFILKFLQNKDKSLRVASLWCILNLVYPGCESSSSRIARLKDVGIISQLNTMVNDPCLDCKLRVRMVLEKCLDIKNSQNDQ